MEKQELIWLQMILARNDSMDKIANMQECVNKLVGLDVGYSFESERN